MHRIKVRFPIAGAATAGLWALSSAAAAADLVPTIDNLAVGGHVGAVNQGDMPSGPAVLTIVCSKNGGGSCAEAAGMAAYENPAYPNAVTVSLPGLAPGDSFDHALAFWNELDWDAGSYTLTVLVDAGNAVEESNERNNSAATVKVQRASSVGTPVPTGPGDLAPGNLPPSGRDAAPAGTLVAGLPDIIPTSLGFIMKSGPVKWGASVTIDNPAAADAARQGPQRNLCSFSPAAYRTHNKGPVAAGAFVTKVYRDNALVHTHNVPGGLPAKSGIDWHKFALQLHEGLNVVKVVFDADKQVGESDEKNGYSIRVNVRIDCDGDGKAGIGGLKAPDGNPPPGSGPQLRSAMPW
jgi:hypothetical protein